MTMLDAAPYVAILVSLIVWALTQRANRHHEIFKERLRRRVEMFDDLMPAIRNFNDALIAYNKDNQNEADVHIAWHDLCDFRVKILCYGSAKEQSLYDELIDVLGKRDLAAFPEKNNAFVRLITQNLRSELQLD